MVVLDNLSKKCLRKINPMSPSLSNSTPEKPKKSAKKNKKNQSDPQESFVEPAPS